MIRLSIAAVCALALYYGFPPAVSVIGATAEHFFGQDGEE